MTFHSFNFSEDSIEIESSTLTPATVVKDDVADFDLTPGAPTQEAQMAAAHGDGKEWFYAYDDTQHVGEMYHYNGGTSHWDNVAHFDFDGYNGPHTLGTGTGTVLTITSPT